MSAYERGLELVGKLEAAGLRATVDPRGATPPCILVTPPGRLYDLSCGYTASWQLIVLAPATANADAFKLLDDLMDQIIGVVEVRNADFISYALSADNPPHPAYRITFEEGISWP
jgi:hypothetical protein